jgi:hypothetical protein
VTLPTAAPRLRPSDLLAAFFATGIAFLLAGAAVAVVHATTGWVAGHWLALHLVFVGGVSQLVLGAGQFSAHFRIEEQVLLPAYAGQGDPHHPLVARALCDHVEIRSRAAAVARDPAPGAIALNELGARIGDHVRLEERELFPLIEQALPAERLATLAAELAHAEAAEGTPADG